MRTTARFVGNITGLKQGHGVAVAEELGRGIHYRRGGKRKLSFLI